MVSGPFCIDIYPADWWAVAATAPPPHPALITWPAGDVIKSHLLIALKLFPTGGATEKVFAILKYLADCFPIYWRAPGEGIALAVLSIFEVCFLKTVMSIQYPQANDATIGPAGQQSLSLSLSLCLSNPP